MGGGGAIRAAGKAASFAGYRSSSLVDQIPTAGSRRVVSPIPAVASQSSIRNSPISASSNNVGVQSEKKQTSWVNSVDEWEFVGRKEEDLFDQLNSAPRIVFGSVPTPEEAEEATSDLKDAVEKIYFSSPTVVTEDSAPFYKNVLHKSAYSESLQNVVQSTIGCSAILPSAPKHVIQAFSLLQESPEVQGVVASLAADINVWDAVMKNEKVMEFYKSHQTNDIQQEQTGIAESDDREDDMENFKEKPSGRTENRFVGLVKSIKKKVVDMVSNISDLIQNFFSTSAEPREGNNADNNNNNNMIQRSFIALAVAVILIILAKRA